MKGTEKFSLDTLYLPAERHGLILDTFKHMRTLYSAILCFFLYSCGPTPQADLSDYRKEKKTRVLQSYSQGEIIEQATQQAKQVIAKIENNTLPKLPKGVICVRITTEKPSEYEKENLIFEAYQYSLSTNSKLRDNTQLINKTHIYN
ncbi:MAG: hypothetical protein AB8B61_00945, partial [Cyclobacteriaceae bacterium]